MNQLIVITCLIALSHAGPYQKNEETQALNSLTEAKAQEKEITSYPQNDQSIEKDNQYASSQILENPAYDPSLYQSFIPQDAVQQYVNHFGSPYGGYPGAYANPPGFAVQTGYEGYLVPTVAQPESTSLTTTGFNLLRSLLSRSLFEWFARTGSYLLQAFGVVLFGGALTTALCTFTPFCTISFAALPFLRLRDTAKNITKTLGAEITPERVRRTAALVKEAIDKYTEMQEDGDGDDESNVQKIEKLAKKLD